MTTFRVFLSNGSALNVDAESPDAARIASPVLRAIKREFDRHPRGYHLVNVTKIKRVRV